MNKIKIALFDANTCSNEVCYKGANLANCKQTHEKKCF